ncbi:hypothetical protein [Streptomyces chattanoogensis]|uniref:hypothetical protein n=1 Tax=Streptomyces chattanoogensis TaxID=66876 RepID=UPI0036B48796
MHDCDCDVCKGSARAPALHVLTDIPDHELDLTPRRKRAKMKEQLAELRVNDYVRAEGVDTRGHNVVRTGHLLAPPKEVSAQRNGRRAQGWRLFVGLAGTSIDQRSTWVTLFPGSGAIEHARQPEIGEWQQTPFGKIPGMRTSPDVNVRVLFGGKGGKRSKEPTQSTLARLVHNPDKHRYEVRDAETGETLLCPSWQTSIWWAVAPAEEEHGDRDQAEEPKPAEEPVVEPAAATVDDDLGQPVHHVQTGKLVGYLTPERFIPIDQVEKR